MIDKGGDKFYNKTMNDKNKENKVIKAGIGYTIGNYMLKGLSFLTVPIFSRLLSTAEYGIFDSYLAYQSIVFILVGLALHTSLKNAKYKYKDEFANYNSCCMIVVMLNLLLWFIVCNLTYPLYGEFLGYSRLIVNLLLLNSFGTALIQFYNVYIGLDYKYSSFLKLSAFNAVGSLILSVTLIVTIFRNDRAEGRIIGNVVPVILISLFIISYFWRMAGPKWNRQYVRFAVGYSLPLIPHGISQVILSQFDRIMIRHMIGPSQAGIYGFAYNIFSIINVTSSSLDNVWGPWFYEKMVAKEYETIRKQSAKYAFGMLLFSMMVMLGTPELVKILGSEVYWDAMYSVIPIVIGGYFVFLYTLPSSVEYFHAKTSYIAVGTGMAALINIVLNFVFIPRLGYLAAAYTTLVTYFLYFAFHYIIAWRVQKECIFDTKRIIWYILLILAAGAVALVLIEHWLIRWVLLILLGIGGILWAEREFKVREKIRGRFGR